MWRTPAPPSTARVAASIWSGTGEVKTFPAQAASSMPRPTKPPWSGSWPEPPPDTRATLPRRGPPARRTTLLAASILTTSGWALARPARLSGTMSSTRLRSFFIALVVVTMGFPFRCQVVRTTRTTTGLRLCAGGRPNRRGRLLGLATDQLVQAGADQAARDRAHDVDPQLGDAITRLAEADHGLEQHRTDLASRVERGAGDRADQDDDPVDDEADDDARESGRRAAVDGRTEDDEDEDRGADDLGQDSDERTGIGVDPDRAQSELGRIVADEHGQRQCRADQRADHLRHDVVRRGRPIDLPVDGQGDRDGRVDVGAADVADGIDGGEDRDGERERDRGQLGAAEWIVAGQEDGERHGARADEHEDRGAESLRAELLGEGRGRHRVPPSGLGGQFALDERRRFGDQRRDVRREL